MMRIKLLAVIATSGLAVASTLAEARGPGGGQSSMGGGYGNAPAQTQQGTMSASRIQDQERSKSREQARTQDQQRTRSKDQDRTRTHDQVR